MLAWEEAQTSMDINHTQQGRLFLACKCKRALSMHMASLPHNSIPTSNANSRSRQPVFACLLEFAQPLVIPEDLNEERQRSI
eukprot:719769-Pelagomonas_calceolata.AAC.2